MIKNNLKQIRMQEYMLDRVEFAKMLNIAYSTYVGWELGKSNPTLKQALLIADKLNKPLTDIWYLDKN